jgi:replication-associated recombination protein RarA
MAAPIRLYLGRRIIRMAVEDIGLADPRALTTALDAVATFERLGSPEGELALAQAVLYLAVAPKSNAVYTAYKAAQTFVAQDGSRPVPVHLRNAPTKLMKELGYGHAYRYAHDEAEAYAAGEHYFPDELPSLPVSTSRRHVAWKARSANVWPISSRLIRQQVNPASNRHRQTISVNIGWLELPSLPIALNC